MGEEPSEQFELSKMLFPLLLLILFWESALYMYYYFFENEQYGLFSSLILPSPSQIILAFIHNRSIVWPHFIATFSAITGSLLAALLFSIPIGFIMTYSRKCSYFIQTIFILFKSVPSFSFAPILIIFTGWGGISSFFPAVIAAIIPITMSIFSHVQQDMGQIIAYFTSMNATLFQYFTLFYLPAMRLSLFSGFRIAITGAGMATVASEWCGAKKGLGILLMDMREQMNITMMFVCIVSLSLITGSIYLITYLIEHLVEHRKRGFFE